MNEHLTPSISNSAGWLAYDFKKRLPLFLFGILWLDLFRQLSYQWSATEQYAYGWFVPILGLGLFCRRWITRPTPHTELVPPWVSWLMGGLLASLLPVRIVYEINPDWPLCGWLFGMAVVMLSLYSVFLVGGWRWVKHFVFPICFILVAVRWPYRIEHGLIQGLTGAVSSMTVEVLGWFGVPALQHGNVIELNAAQVGVEEACSGIRSFQSTVMGALFLGELFLLKGRLRWLLLLMGVIAAFALNLIRTLFLTWQASSHGGAAAASWHNSAGWGIFVATFLVLWVVAIWLRPTTQPVIQFANTHSSVKLPTPFVYAVGIWILVLVAGNELWFRLHDFRAPAVVDWAVRLPTETTGFKDIQLTDAQSTLLKQDTSSAGSWQDAAGRIWTVYYLRWFQGSILSRIKARAHRPEICLSASGYRLEKDFGSVLLKVGNLELPFRRYLFDNLGNNVYVFFCLWEDGAEQLPQTENLTYRDRLRAALKGQRLVGQRSVEIILRGCPNLATAESAIQEHLTKLIRI